MVSLLYLALVEMD